jgi:hypothetical protein
MQIEGLGAGQDRGQPAPCLRLTRRSPNFRVMPNLLKCWPHLTPEERETVQFAARYCGQHIGLAAATRELVMFSDREKVISALRIRNAN